MFQRLLTLSALMMLALSPALHAADYKAGEDYDIIAPPIRGSSDKIEVMEFFWYGCGHCYNFEPKVAQWKKSLPDDVKVQGSPAMWRPIMETHAKAFYAAEVLGVLDTMHMPLFQAINIDRKPLADEDSLADLFEKHGVDREEFLKAFRSFGVGSQVRQADARAKAARISGTPEMMVAGKYRISTRKAGSQEGMLKVAEFLIEKERAERAAGSDEVAATSGN